MSLRGYKTTPRSILSVRESALKARDEFGMGDAAVDGPRLLELLVLSDITYDIVPDSYLLELGGVEASWQPDEQCMSITQSTYDRLVSGDGRARYTICHELGHRELGHKPPPPLLHRNAPSHRAYEDTEWQADQFAAEMTMPLPIILQEGIRTAEGIRKRFGVSMRAAEIRLERLQREGVFQEKAPKRANT